MEELNLMDSNRGLLDFCVHMVSRRKPTVASDLKA